MVGEGMVGRWQGIGWWEGGRGWDGEGGRGRMVRGHAAIVTALSHFG